MNQSTAPDGSQSPALRSTIGLLIVAAVAVLLFVYTFSNDAEQDAAAGQQAGELVTAYPAGTPQGDSMAAYPIATLPSDGMAPPYPAPESSSQDPARESTIVLEEVLLSTGVLGVVIDENFTILHVESGGAADKADIVVGDVLVSIGGVILTSESIDEAKHAILEARREMSIEVVLVRDAQTIQLNVVPSAPASRELTPTPVLDPHDYL